MATTAEVIKNDINMKVITCNKAFGQNSESGDFCLLSDTKVTARRLTLEMTDTSIVRLTLLKYDNSCMTVGRVNPKDRVRTVDLIFSSGEVLDDIQVFTNTTTQKLCGIRIVNGTGKVLEVYVDKSNKGVPHRVPKGSGRFVGIFGDANVEVVSLGIAMRREDLLEERKRLDALEAEMETREPERERRERFRREMEQQRK